MTIQLSGTASRHLWQLSHSVRGFADSLDYYIMLQEEITMKETKLTREYTVTEEMLAVNMGSGSVRVLATPMIAAFLKAQPPRWHKRIWKIYILQSVQKSP